MMLKKWSSWPDLPCDATARNGVRIRRKRFGSTELLLFHGVRRGWCNRGNPRCRCCCCCCSPPSINAATAAPRTKTPPPRSLLILQQQKLHHRIIPRQHPAKHPFFFFFQLWRRRRRSTTTTTTMWQLQNMAILFFSKYGEFATKKKTQKNPENPF